MANAKDRVIELDWRWFQGEFRNVRELQDLATKRRVNHGTELTAFGFPAPILSATEHTSRAATPAQ